MTVREAVEQDFDSILDMSEEFWQHTQFKDFAFDRDHTRKMVQMSYDHGLLAVAEIDGDIVGFIAAIKAFMLASTEAMTATDLAWWVNPESRGSNLGIKLIKKLESLAIREDVATLNLAFMETSMPKQVEKMYLNLGYVLAETVYTKVLNGNYNVHGISSDR